MRETTDAVNGSAIDGGDSDARWLWALALVLLGVEAWMRRKVRRTNDGSRMTTARVVVSEFLDAAAKRVQRLSVARGAFIGATVAVLFELGLLAAATVHVQPTKHFASAGPRCRVAPSRCWRSGRIRAGSRHSRTRGGDGGTARAAESQPAHHGGRAGSRESGVTDQSIASTRPEVASLVHAQAATLTRTLSLPALFPSKRVTQELGGILVLLAALVALPHSTDSVRSAADSVRRAVTPRSSAIDRIEITATPPAYAGRAPERSTDPERIAVLAGSRIQVDVRSGAGQVRIATADDTAQMKSDGGSFRAVLPVESDGFIVVESFDSTGTRDRRLIGVTAERDKSPRVRILAPAKDLVLRDSAQVIPLTVEADDDLALSSLRLRYTKVSGSGERFTFAEGEVPLQLTRRSERLWNARANWSLASLGLVAGDMVVYRAVAGDRRPGAVPSESDAFIAQLLVSEGDAAPGFAVDPDEERQALSQQMVILKTRAPAGASTHDVSGSVCRGGAQPGHRAASRARGIRVHDGWRAGGRSGVREQHERSRRDARSGERERSRRRTHGESGAHGAARRHTCDESRSDGALGW